METEPALSALEQVTYCHPRELHQLARRFDLAIVANCLEHLNKTEGEQLLGRLKNLLTSQIWLLIERNYWQPNDLLAMGFVADQRFLRHPTLASYNYNLSSYNFKRPWNNPKHWANPENWGKYWW